MVNINHGVIGDPYIHEPKGVATAQAGTVYVADGSTSGNWKTNHQHLGAYLPFSTAAPQLHSTTTADTVLGATFTLATAEGFSVNTSPTPRFTYIGADTMDAHLLFSFSSNLDSGPDADVEWALFKNGVELTGSRTVRTLGTGPWGAMTVAGYTALASNDYIEIRTKASRLSSVNYASGTFSIMGVAA